MEDMQKEFKSGPYEPRSWPKGAPVAAKYQGTRTKHMIFLCYESLRVRSQHFFFVRKYRQFFWTAHALTHIVNIFFVVIVSVPFMRKHLHSKNYVFV